jgi:hypothetical protein
LGEYGEFVDMLQIIGGPLKRLDAVLAKAHKIPLSRNPS